MTRLDWEQRIREDYSAEGEFLWARYPDFEIFRHAGNRKWFALIGTVPLKSLGLPQDGTLLFMNLKCDPLLIGTLRRKPGFYPAWHMSKTSWITVALDGTVPEDEIRFLLDRSYGLTAGTKR